MPKEPALKRSWWRTLPGMLTAVAGLITAVTGLLLALSEGGLLFHRKEHGIGGTGPTPEQRAPLPMPRAPSPPEEHAAGPLEVRVLRVSREESQITIEYGLINNGDAKITVGEEDVRLWLQDLPLAPTGGDLSGDEKLSVASHGPQVTNSRFSAKAEPGTRMVLQVGKSGGRQARVPVVVPE